MKKEKSDFYLPSKESLWEKYAIIPFFLATAALCGGFWYLAEKESTKDISTETQPPIKHHQCIERTNR